MTRMDQGDDRLARLASGGDRAAFEAIYARHHQAIYRYCLSILHDQDDARDALQSAMEKAFRSMPSQRVKGGLRSWLFTIAHNEAVSIAGRREPVTDDALVLAATGPDLEATAGARERLRELVRDLRRLPERQRGALLMREMSGLSYEEVGAALAMSPRAARQTVYEARVALLDLGEGRDMGCDRVMKKISGGDGRVARGRKIRAHLAECTLCSAFQAGIAGRTGDYALVFPALPAVAAAAVLQSAMAGAGSGAATGGAAGAGPEVGAGSSSRGSAGRAVIALAVAALALAIAVGSLFGGGDGSRLPSAASPGGPSVAEAATPDRSDDSPEGDDPVGVRRSASVEGYSQLPGSVIDTAGQGQGPGAGQGGAGGGGGGGRGGLAFTGLEAWTLALFGLGFLALGYALRELAPARARP